MVGETSPARPRLNPASTNCSAPVEGSAINARAINSKSRGSAGLCASRSGALAAPLAARRDSNGTVAS
jgi:hypothetical protein